MLPDHSSYCPGWHPWHVRGSRSSSFVKLGWVRRSWSPQPLSKTRAKHSVAREPKNLTLASFHTHVEFEALGGGSAREHQANLPKPRHERIDRAKLVFSRLVFRHPHRHGCSVTM